jgi:hypothetical protein
MGNSVEDGDSVSRFITAVSVIVAAAIIVGAGGMAVASSNQIAALNATVTTGFGDMAKRLDRLEDKVDNPHR